MNNLQDTKNSQPEQETVAWKLVPTEPTDEMLKAMDECSTEGYDERLYAGHAASVYMAAVDVAPTPPKPEQEPVAWMYQDKSTHQVSFQKHMKAFVDHSKTSEVPLYGKPLANHELQCVCGAVWCGDEMVHLPNKTPPQPKQDKERCVGCEACIDTACGRDECPKGWPKAAQPAVAEQHKQEPVAHFGSAYVNENGVHITTVLGPVAIPQDAKLYTTPPQRKPLTDEEIGAILEGVNAYGTRLYTFARAIEAKLKEKNT